VVLGLCISALVLSCRTTDGNQEEITPEVVVPHIILEPPTPMQTTEMRKFRATYLITTEPTGVGVYRELGELVGITPVSIEFQFERITRLTFLKAGYLIKSQILEPLDGDHTIHVVMEPNTP